MKIKFGDYDFRIGADEQRQSVFDVVRKRWVALTPEEWVRQNWIHYLIEDKAYPRSLLAVEMPLKVNTMSRRADLVAFGKEGNPVLIIECKAPDRILRQETLEQAARYNLTLRVPYLVVSNGRSSLGCRINWKDKSFDPIEAIPEFGELVQ